MASSAMLTLEDSRHRILPCERLFPSLLDTHRHTLAIVLRRPGQVISPPGFSMEIKQERFHSGPSDHLQPYRPQPLAARCPASPSTQPKMSIGETMQTIYPRACVVFGSFHWPTNVALDRQC